MARMLLRQRQQQQRWRWRQQQAAAAISRAGGGPPRVADDPPNRSHRLTCRIMCEINRTERVRLLGQDPPQVVDDALKGGPVVRVVRPAALDQCSVGGQLRRGAAGVVGLAGLGAGASPVATAARHRRTRAATAGRGARNEHRHTHMHEQHAWDRIFLSAPASRRPQLAATPPTHPPAARRLRCRRASRAAAARGRPAAAAPGSRRS